MAKKKNRVDPLWASLAALSAAAVVGAPGQAAASVVTSGALNIQIGTMGSPYPNTASIPIKSGTHTIAAIHLATRTWTSSSAPKWFGVKQWGNRSANHKTSMNFLVQMQSSISWLALFGPGAKWATQVGQNGIRTEWPRASITSASAAVAASSTGGAQRPAAPGVEYALFQFHPNGSTSVTDNGWLQVEIGYGADPYTSVDVTGWAYSTSGSLPAGSDQVPEPSSLSLELAALVLGAAGLRRWRAARAEAA